MERITSRHLAALLNAVRIAEHRPEDKHVQIMGFNVGALRLAHQASGYMVEEVSTPGGGVHEECCYRMTARECWFFLRGRLSAPKQTQPY